jgi:hypothetical protein
MSLAHTCPARELELELLDPGSVTLVRLFKFPGGEWSPPPPVYRNLRVDPPAGHKDDYAVLYTGDDLAAVATECLILQTGEGDRAIWRQDKAVGYRVARYGFLKPALFLPIDGKNRQRLGMAGGQRPWGGYDAWQETGLALHQRFAHVVHGLSWESFHRNQPGRVYALWHDHKPTIDLQLTTPGDYPLLTEDTQWLAFLAAHPEIEAIDVGGSAMPPI